MPWLSGKESDLISRKKGVRTSYTVQINGVDYWKMTVSHLLDVCDDHPVRTEKWDRLPYTLQIRRYMIPNILLIYFIYNIL